MSVKGGSNYFQNDREFRVILEWVKGANVGLGTARHAVIGVYVPIKNGAFDTAGVSTYQPKSWGFTAFGDYSANYFCKWNKATSWVLDKKSPADSGMNINGNTKMDGGYGNLGFDRPMKIAANSKLDLNIGDTYSMGLSWGVMQAW